MNFLEAIAELQKPENIETKCIRPDGWEEHEYFTIEWGYEAILVYNTQMHDIYDSDGFYIPYQIDVLTGEWIVSTIPDIPPIPEDTNGDEE